MSRLFSFAVAALSVLVLGSSAFAHELDNDSSVSTDQVRLGQNLPKTVIVRTKVGTKQTEVLQLNHKLPAGAAAKALVAKAKFSKLDNKGRPMNELDQDSSASSWYFYCPPSYPGYYYPTYYYYNYTYAYMPYYGYYYGGYYYQYYSWPYC